MFYQKTAGAASKF
jgi:hypothetical protein